MKKKTVKKKKPPQKNNEKFFNRVKEFLLKERIELIDIKNFSKNELSLIVKEEGKEILLVAYNKKRINEDDLIKTSEKASELDLPYMIFCLGEPLKKLTNLIKAIQNLLKIKKIE